MSELNCNASKRVKKVISDKNAQLVCVNEIPKYSKKQFKEVYKGYDFLENLFTIRTYIQKKHNVPYEFLELMLRLMGLNLFTMVDFFDTPRTFTYKKWNSIKESGYINLVMDDKDVMKRVYCLNKKGQNIVIDFYECLSGEKRIPESPEENPFEDDSKKVDFDRKKMELIKKLNKLPVPDHKKHLFRG
ncbi:hypothetical protein [Wenyingzhuangia sp. 2_MG-2023]|uniref:hypothetical protein n=1 Tax=Wenyingzhuangia sp. 2_MG-2023 TaxID=3062639 RepID=UPI0026E2B642|nr:hypothetical protein [Wenyingzhuangia sp. 2_MG-2023]MDO6737082.1 hypothetical protein [Wenyingzhuangia sp. 2_MG-2023]